MPDTLIEVLKLLGRLSDVADRLLKLSHESNLNNWITDLEASIDKMETAKTPGEKLEAARSLASCIHRL